MFGDKNSNLLQQLMDMLHKATCELANLKKQLPPMENQPLPGKQIENQNGGSQRETSTDH
jgi:hypothetical protein